MSDSTFEKSIIILSLAMLLLFLLGFALLALKGSSPVPFIVLALAGEIVGSTLLLYSWGKSYMAKR